MTDLLLKPLPEKKLTYNERIAGLKMLATFILMEEKSENGNILSQSFSKKKVSEKYDKFINEIANEAITNTAKALSAKVSLELTDLYRQRQKNINQYDTINSEIEKLAKSYRKDIPDSALKELTKKTDQGPKKDAANRIKYLFNDISAGKDTLNNKLIPKYLELKNINSNNLFLQAAPDRFSIPLILLFEMCDLDSVKCQRILDFFESEFSIKL